MTGGWDDYAAALRFRNLIEDIATKQAEKVMPADFTAQVVSIDVPNLVASVKQSGDAGILIAKFSPSLQPRTVGCFVRISGYPGNYYISAILDEAGINQVYEETTQQALDTANQALGLIATDELPPTQAPVVTMNPLGYSAVLIKWNAITNADPVQYRVLLDKVSPPAQVLTTTTGLITSTSQLTNGELLDPSQTYYAQVIPFDADGDGPASAIVTGGPVVVPADAVSIDVLVANEFFSREAYFGTISANQIVTGSMTATIDVTTGKINLGTITLDAATGIRIPLPNGGQIVFPNNGTDAIFEKIRIHATSATFDGSVDIQGQDNKLSGRLLLVGSILPPSLAPQAVSVYDQSPLTFSVNGAYAGIGDNGTYWQTAVNTAYDGATGIATTVIYNFDKSTGARTTAWTVNTDFYDVHQSSYTADQPGNPYTTYTEIQGGNAPAPQILSFHSVGSIAVVSYYLPAYSYTVIHRTTYGEFMNSSVVTQSARYQIVVVNNTTGALISNFYWSEFSSWYNPVVFTDGTYVYVGACYKGANQTNLYRYTTSGGDANTAPFPYVFTSLWGVNYTGMWMGTADLGAQRFIFHTSSSLYMVDTAGTIQSAQQWSLPEYTRGIVYYNSRFYMHGGSGKMWKASGVVADTARTVKYTWYDGVGTLHESTPSPAATPTQSARRYLQVITGPIPNSGGTEDPTSVRIYIDAHRQADLSPGLTTVTYDIPSTANPDAPTTDGFAAIGGHGSFESSIRAAARVQQITITGTPSGGSFQLTYAGSTSAAIAFNATAATVQTTINNMLAALGAGTVTVGGGPGPGSPWLVSFSNANPLQLGSVNNLTGGLTPTITISNGPPVTQFQGDGSWHLSSLTGMIMPYAGDTAPDGFLMCDGQAVSRLTYAELYRVIGTKYGAGDGSTTFNVPNLQGRTVVGMHHGVGGAADAEFDTLGEASGEKYHLLTAAESGLQDHQHSGGAAGPYMTPQGTFYGLVTSANTGGVYGGGRNATNAHNNIQPYITLNYLIKV